jgi:hypothetical protein
VYDAVANRLLYAIQYAPPLDDPAYDAWAPASDFGLTDAQLQAHIKASQDEAPVVFEGPFTGPPGLDRSQPVALRIVLDEVEGPQYNDGQGPGVPVDDGGGQETVEQDNGKHIQESGAQGAAAGAAASAHGSLDSIVERAATAAARAAATAVKREVIAGEMGRLGLAFQEDAARAAAPAQPKLTGGARAANHIGRVKRNGDPWFRDSRGAVW